MMMKLEALQAKCRALGLKVQQNGKRTTKDDYTQALRAHYLPKDGLPYTEISPMLCFAEWNLKPEEAEEIWKSPRWAAQRKLNGCRALIHFVKGVGTFAHSRTTSVKTFRYQELTDKLLFCEFVPDFSATVDCELLIDKPIDTRAYTAKGEITKSSLHSTTSALHLEAGASRLMQVEQSAPLIAHVFDILAIDGMDWTKAPLAHRLITLNTFKHKIRATDTGTYFEFPEYVTENKREFYEKIVAEGGEGVILKSLDAPYEASSSRPRTGWVKVKKRQEYDAFVTGFVRGEPGTAWANLVGALEFSVNTEKGPHTLGYAQNMTLETREKISIHDKATGELKLHPAVYGKVAQISGVEVSGRALRLTHCTIDRWRPKQGPDAKQAAECKTSMADLRAAAEWVSG